MIYPCSDASIFTLPEIGSLSLGPQCMSCLSWQPPEQG